MTSPCVRAALRCAALILAVMSPSLARVAAITITMEYTDEGDPLPHPENPSWDADGVILKRHFAQAKQIWESLLPGPGNYEFDFHWDDDIGSNVLGLTTDAGPFDLFIEINPLHDWFADPTPDNDNEYQSVGEQTLYQSLSQADRDANFPGAPPPITLETGYHLKAPDVGPVGAGGFDAKHGHDLLTVILHEMGHALGISGTEPGEYNMLPQHIGNLHNVLVAESEGGGHLSGGDPPGFLMRDTGIPKGQRVLPSATDVLVLAEDQGITNVHLARVGSLADSVWSAPTPWIGGAAPDATQSVYISHGGTTTLDVNAQTRDLWVNSGSQLLVGSRRLDVKKSLLLDNGDVIVGSGGTIAAGSITGATSDLTTAAGSLVRFNNFTNTATTANFSGSVAVGYDTGLVGTATFDPEANSTWNIAQDLAVGDETKAALLVINESADFNSGSGKLGGLGGPTGSSGQVQINGDGSTWTVAGALTVRNGGVDVTNRGRLTTGSAVVGAGAGLATMEVNNGTWNVGNNLEVGPSTPTGDGGGSVSIRNGGVVDVNGNLSVRGTATRAGQINVRSAGSLNVDGAVTVGPNGVIAFHDQVRGQGAMIGAAGYENLGSPIDTGAGGVTQFNDQASAGGAHFTNRGGGSQFASGGRTEFRGFSTAASGQFDNYASTAGLYSGVTRFFDFATAGNADFFNHPGPLSNYATVEFNGDSTGGDARFYNLPGVLGQSLGGAFVFNDRSTVGRGFYITQGEGGYVTFNDAASADRGTFAMVDTVGGNSRTAFLENSTAANATFSMGANTILAFDGSSTAANAHIDVRRGGYVSFAGQFSATGPTTTAGNALIVLDGGASVGGYGGTASFSTWSTAGNATITANGGTVNGSGGATVNFDYAAHAGAATIIANGGANGGAGAVVYFRRAATGDNARLIVNQAAVGDFSGNRYDGTSIGSIEGAGTFIVNGGELRAGSLNTSTTVSGPVIDELGSGFGGRFTKIGVGKLTLAGGNTYTGLTTIRLYTFPLACRGTVGCRMAVCAMPAI